ncbi:MAG TPA: hypothetical protein VF717_01295 [Pyrinomonadaceae bacterium]|jgi:hypothetical protein
MNILRRYQEYRHRKDYEKDVRFRMNHTPYGEMYGQVLAYRRAKVKRSGSEDEQARVEAARNLKESARVVFMSHPAATGQDFERCWPSIRDQMLIRYTLSGLDIMMAGSKP